MKIVAAICLFVFSCIYEQNWPYSWWPMATELTMGGDMAKYNKKWQWQWHFIATSEAEGCPVYLVPPDKFIFQKNSKWLQWVKPTWQPSAWTSARHWAAKARLSSSPSPWALTSPSPWTQGGWPWTSRPRFHSRRSPAHPPSGGMPGAGKCSWTRSGTLHLHLLQGLSSILLRCQLLKRSACLMQWLILIWHQFMTKAGLKLLLSLHLLHLHLNQRVLLLPLDRAVKRALCHLLHLLCHWSVIGIFTQTQGVERLSIVKKISGNILMKSTMSVSGMAEQFPDLSFFANVIDLWQSFPTG